MEIILASASPRRRELLAMITPDFRVLPADVDEAAAAEEGLPPQQAVAQLAAAKARALAEENPRVAILGCDTVVELDGEILGKPGSAHEAAEMLHRLSGRAHFVHTGICLLYPEEGKTKAACKEFVETTKVFFSPLPAEDIARYTKTAEPYDKAGAYGIQGWAAKYIPRIEGCYYNVMGLPVAALSQRLQQAGLVL